MPAMMVRGGDSPTLGVKRAAEGLAASLPTTRSGIILPLNAVNP